MANQHTKKRIEEQEQADLARLAASKPDPNFGHLLPGPSNEEVAAKQAELNALLAEKGYPKVSVVRDAKEKAADARRAGVKTGEVMEMPEDLDKQFDAWADLEHDPLGLADPIAAIKQQYERPGFAIKLLSDNCNGHLGLRGYRPVISKGDVVKFGKMTVGEMPEKYAAARRKAAEQAARDKIRNVNDGMRAKMDQLRSEANGMGLDLIERGDKAPDQNGMDRQAGISVERERIDAN